MKSISIFGILLFTLCRLTAQVLPLTIHAEQQDYYYQFGERNAGFYDSLNGYTGKLNLDHRSDCQLNKIVFGFHPYWAGSDYLNYQWNLLSDFCYFSYEVDPSNGDPVSYHDWLTDPAIDSAQANGVNVHLCATLFSGHNGFFTSLSSRENLIDNLVLLVEQRNADGVNMDIEAVPAYLRDSITAFIRDLSIQLKSAVPGAKISIDLPAVDWDGAFNINQLDPYVDYFFVMAYDYYWNGSDEAGPVSPLYSMTPDYDYSLSRSLSTLEANGVRSNKFILGIPYYGRQWKTQTNTIPSHKLANGTALTYANILNNSGIYNSSDYHWEPNSFSSCYIFFQNDNWYQCFIGLERDLRKKYDIVNYRKLAGIGIWALGYDNGYPGLWQAISDKFSDCYIPLSSDTIFDSGGPAWDYYTGEYYILTIDHGFNDPRYLSFTDFNLEEGYDSLWLYAGPDTSFNLLGKFTGSEKPGNFSSPNGAFTLRFRSDALQNKPGWKAVYHDGSFGLEENNSGKSASLLIFPNPADQYINLIIPGNDRFEKLMVYDFAGRILNCQDIKGNHFVNNTIHLDISDLPEGIYTITFLNNSKQATSSQFIKLNR